MSRKHITVHRGRTVVASRGDMAAALTIYRLMREPLYNVKCDQCKLTIKTTTSLRESVAGGTCPDCQEKAGHERMR